MQLDDLKATVAGGTMAGSSRLDSRSDAAVPASGAAPAR
jgi:hypothetical protein